MSDGEREKFINKFEKETENIIGFCVLGGIFSEGIDLTGDKIIGAIIIGVGLPQICVERNLIKIIMTINYSLASSTHIFIQG